MSDRSRLIITLGLSAFLALLTWLPVAPTQPSVLTPDSIHPNNYQRAPARFRGGATAYLLAAVGIDAHLCASDLPCEPDDQDGTKVEERDRAEALDDPRPTFLIACVFHDLSDRQAIAPPSTTSLYPLRC